MVGKGEKEVNEKTVMEEAIMEVKEENVPKKLDAFTFVHSAPW